ncbi:MAG: hypothetical protein IPM82_15920 [Saprospiraceae bacterium]|nr:hypothetical protein [Saprospiraceae bacterium]
MLTVGSIAQVSPGAVSVTACASEVSALSLSGAWVQANVNIMANALKLKKMVFFMLS